MILTHTRFGTLEFTDQDIISFPEGLIGFEGHTQFVLVPSKPGSPFSWLQSTNDPSLAFLVADPNAFFNDYSPELSDRDASTLGLSESSDYALVVTAAIPSGQPNNATANLAAPIIINLDSRIGKQVILENEAYTMRHPIFAEQRKPAQKVAA